MAYKIGLKLWSINTDCYLEEARRLYDGGIFDYVELYVVPESLATLTAWKRLAVPYIIHNAHFAHGFNLACREKASTNRRIYEESARFADGLKAARIIFHGGIDGDVEETCRQLASFSEPRALIENKPFIALPNRMGGESCRGATTEEITRIREETGCSFCLDFGHAVCSAAWRRQDPYEFIAELAATAPAMYHLSDVADLASPYDAHPHLQTGMLDLGRILILIPDCSAPISIETNKDQPDRLDDFAEDAAILRKLEEKRSFV